MVILKPQWMPWCVSESLPLPSRKSRVWPLPVLRCPGDNGLADLREPTEL